MRSTRRIRLRRPAEMAIGSVVMMGGGYSDASRRSIAEGEKVRGCGWPLTVAQRIRTVSHQDL